MHINFQQQVPADFHPQSKVWIYQSSRPFSGMETIQVENILNDFLKSWKSHGASVKGFAQLFFGQFIVLMADETKATVGGCSTDTSVRLIKEIAERFEVDLLNRQQLAFLINDAIELIPVSQLNSAWEKGIIHHDTIYFNNLVPDKTALLQNWLQPVKESWLMQKLLQLAQTK